MNESNKARNYEVLKEAHRKQAEKEEQDRQVLENAEKDEQQKQETFKKEDQQKQDFFQKEEQQKKEFFEKEDRQKQENQKQEGLRAEQAAKENASRLVEQAREMVQLEEAHQRLEEYRQQQEQEQEAAKARRQERDKEGSSYQEGEIRDAHSRYGQALGQHYDIRNPYGSLARVSMAEYGAFLKDRENLNQQIAQEKDPAARERLEQRKQIESADYMAITSHRIAAQSECITGRSNSEEAQKQRGRAEAYQKESKELREQWREGHKNRESMEPAQQEKTKKNEQTKEQKQPVQQAEAELPEGKSRSEYACERAEQLRQESKDRERNNGLEL